MPGAIAGKKRELIAEAALSVWCSGDMRSFHETMLTPVEEGGWGWTQWDAEFWLNTNEAQVKALSERLVDIVAKEVVV